MAKPHGKNIDIWSVLILFSLGMLDAMLWRGIFQQTIPQAPQIYFFNVTQGESAMAVFQHNIKIMVDAGGDNKIVGELDSALSSASDNYIDVAIISYPQLDNYEGYDYILDHYTVGAFVYNGRNDVADAKEWAAFLQKLQAKHIPLVTLSAGDSIHYGSSVINILSPTKDVVRSSDLTDTALMENIHTATFSALLASDIGKDVEDVLIAHSSFLHADIFKAPFPASGSTSTQDFLHDVNPKLIIISPGIKNNPSSPSKSPMAGLSSSTKAEILRTDQHGTIVISSNNSKLRIMKEK